MLRFYTLPPRDRYWPYLMVNPRTRKELYKRKFEHAIFDSGVEVFKHNPALREYPARFLREWKGMARMMTRIFEGRLWVTVPDYPDDYHPGQFGDNVSKTLMNVEEFISVDGVEWLVPVQSRFQKILTFYESLQRTKELIGNHPRIAIGTVCKSRSVKFILHAFEAARKIYPNSHIHAFGPTLTAMKKLEPPFPIDSFDSMAWGFPRLSFKEWTKKTGLKPFPNTPPQTAAGRSYANKIFWEAYLKRLNEIFGEELYIVEENV